MSLESANTQEYTKSEWVKECSQLQVLGNQLIEELDRVYEDYSYPQMAEVMKEYLKSSGLTREQAYPYASFHILIGSTPSYEKQPYIDLDGDKSVVAYIRKKIEELKQVNKSE